MKGNPSHELDTLNNYAPALMDPLALMAKIVDALVVDALVVHALLEKGG